MDGRKYIVEFVENEVTVHMGRNLSWIQCEARDRLSSVKCINVCVRILVARKEIVNSMVME